MTLPLIKDRFLKELEHLYPKTEIESFFHLILEHQFGIRKIDLALKPELLKRPWKIKPFEQALEQLLEERPIQYIIGSTEFAGMLFYVDENVLIPRPETEGLVRWVIEEAHELKSPVILDIGTGSGCIPIVLAKSLPGAKVQALDVSKKALEIAKRNAQRLKAEVKFFEHDILSGDNLEGTYDILVSNPPYVKKSEKEQMRGNVLLHEPEIALFVSDEDPLKYYRRIAEHGKTHLNPGGLLFFEINESLADKTVSLLSDLGYEDIEAKKDIYGRDRMTRAIKK